MFLSEFSIKRPMATLVIIISLMFMGWLALKSLKVNQNPDVQPPVLIVSVPYPGASPETVEREIINRIEKSLRSVSGVYELNATANEGSANFQIRFDFGRNMIEATDDVRNAIATVRYKLPTEMREPIIRRIDMSMQPVVEIGLSSSVQNHAEISRLAEDVLADEFRGVPGVSQVDVYGALKRELTVRIRADKLREHNVAVAEVMNALRTQNLNAPVGKIKGGTEEKSLRLIGRVETPEEFEQIVVKRRGDEMIKLGDLAEVADGFAEVGSYSLRNGLANVTLSITRSPEASTVTVAEEVRKKLEELNKTLPSGTEMVITQDSGEDAENSLNNVVHALVFGAVLTIFVVYFFLNSWRSTLITSLALPTSALTAFIAVWACGFTLNFMTLLGLSLAIGVLIDDAIVVRENIVRHMENGVDRYNASRNGTAEIGLAVAATTFAIVAVFIPVAFMDGMAGQWFRPFALTVAASVLVSLLISFTLDPMLSAYWGDPVGYHHQPKTGLSLWLQKFNIWFDHQSDRYSKVIQWALGHRGKMTAIAVLSLAGAIFLQAQFGGSSFLPSGDFGIIAVDVRTPSGTTVEHARLKVEQAAEIARTITEVKVTNTTTRSTGGRVYVDLGKSTERTRDHRAIAAELREKLKRLVGAEYAVIEEMSNGASKPVNIAFFGEDSRKLQEITDQFMADLHNVNGAVDIALQDQDPKPELQIELDRGLASSLGISMNDAAQALRVAFAGVEVGDWVDPTGETRDVTVQLHADDRANINDLEQLPLLVGNGNTLLPLSQIARISYGRGPATIRHSNGQRMVVVQANVQNRSEGEVVQEAMALANKIDFPPGYGLQLRGAGRDQAEVFSRMAIALFMGIGLMYLILVMQFGSFLAPVPIMMSLPLSLIGVVLALLMTGGTLNLMSFIGVIMLMGLVAKNAILLIDSARKKEQEGMEREAALMAAGRARLRPILMTTFALIAGMMPVAIGIGEGGEFYRPMAVAIIGGTITSTLLTLLMIPCFYDSIAIHQINLKAKFTAREERFGFASAVFMCAFEVVFFMTGLRFIYRQTIGRVISISQRRHQTAVVRS